MNADLRNKNKEDLWNEVCRIAIFIGVDTPRS